MINAATPDRDSISARPRSAPSTLTAVSRPSASESVRRDDGDGNVVDEAHSCCWIDDVGIAAAIDVDVLFTGTRCRDGGVGELEDARDAAERGIVGVNVDTPAALSGRSFAERKVSADSHQRLANAQPIETRDRLARRVSLANRADIERHVLAVQRHGPVTGIQMKVAKPRSHRRLSERRRIRHTSSRSRIAPQSDHGALCDIECATRCRRQILRRASTVKRSSLTRTAWPAGVFGHSIQFAVGLVVGEDSIEIADAIERRRERRRLAASSGV